MAVAELLTEIAKPDYAGLKDAAIAAALNEWQTESTPCRPQSLAIKFKELNLPARVELAYAKKQIDDALYVRWLGLLKASEGEWLVDFYSPPLSVADLIVSLRDAEVIAPPEDVWLCDLGRQQWTIGRKVFQRDVTAADIAKARELQPLHEKIAARRKFVRAEAERMFAEVQAAHDQLQARDGSLRIIADAEAIALPIEWEK